MMQFIFAKLFTLSFMRRRALKGDVLAQYELGRRLDNFGYKCWPEAFAWLRIAADQGHANAQNAANSIEAKLPLELLEKGRKLARHYKMEIRGKRKS